MDSFSYWFSQSPQLVKHFKTRVSMFRWILVSRWPPVWVRTTSSSLGWTCPRFIFFVLCYWYYQYNFSNFLINLFFFQFFYVNNNNVKAASKNTRLNIGNSKVASITSDLGAVTIKTSGVHCLNIYIYIFIYILNWKFFMAALAALLCLLNLFFFFLVVVVVVAAAVIFYCMFYFLF